MTDTAIQIDTRAEIVVLTPAELDTRITRAVHAAREDTQRDLDHLKAAGAAVTFVLLAVMAYVWYRSEPATLARMERRQTAEYVRAEERHDLVMASHAAFMGTLRDHTAIATDKLTDIEDHVTANTARIETLREVYGALS